MIRKIRNLFSYVCWLVTDQGWSTYRESMPCADGKHLTDYELVRAPGSEAVIVMPEHNFLLTSAESQLAEREALAENGFYLMLDTPLQKRIAIHEARAIPV